MKICLSCKEEFRDESRVQVGDRCPLQSCAGMVTTVDEGVIPAVLSLRDAGLLPLYSCAGHPHRERKGTSQVYVLFGVVPDNREEFAAYCAKAVRVIQSVQLPEGLELTPLPNHMSGWFCMAVSTKSRVKFDSAGALSMCSALAAYCNDVKKALAGTELNNEETRGFRKAARSAGLHTAGRKGPRRSPANGS